MGYYCEKCKEHFSGPYYCIHKYNPEAPIFERTKDMKFYCGEVEDAAELDTEEEEEGMETEEDDDDDLDDDEDEDDDI